MIKKLWFAAFLVGSLGAWSVQAQDEFGDDFGDSFGDDEFGFGMPAAEEPELPIATEWELNYTKDFFVELLYVSDDNFKYGEYNGHSEKGFHLIGEFDFISRPGKDDDLDTGFWTLRGDDVGLKTTSIEFEAGRQGHYTFTLDIENHFSVRNDTGFSPFTGGETLTLPGSWVPSNNTSGMSLNGLSDVEQEIGRNQVGLEFVKKLGAFDLTARYDFERKTGDLVQGGAIYLDAQGPLAALVPVPTDYHNHEFGVTVDYVSSALQLQLSLLNSELDATDAGDGNRQLRWQNPYSSSVLVGTNPLVAGVDYPNGFGSLDLPKDRRFQQVRLNGSYIFSPMIRLRLDASHGISKLTDDLS
ncbi:MAG: MtrB/PioB family outer membrane beta-barrel protein, partial [Pseudomonadales bacterium]|nr:MtrB/PioB family outer membrane beta-barrel protein [Pseudomonadales bacterium]